MIAVSNYKKGETGYDESNRTCNPETRWTRLRRIWRAKRRTHAQRNRLCLLPRPRCRVADRWHDHPKGKALFQGRNVRCSYSRKACCDQNVLYATWKGYKARSLCTKRRHNRNGAGCIEGISGDDAACPFAD